MKKKVAILGGGVGGLSAAHELAEEGSFEVHVYEAGPAVGGKARSQSKAGTGTGGRADLPGEHGFRFFPAFYRNVIDTMARIPTTGARTVADNLVGCSEMVMAEPGRAPSTLPRHRPRSIGEFFRVVNAVEDFFRGADVPSADLARFGVKMLEFLCTSDERRFATYEDVPFWSYVKGDSYSPRFQRYINSSRFMVAMDARRGSARTIATKAIQILLDFWRPEGENDRVLDGPTTARWLDPWEAHLRRLGVVFHFNQPVLGLDIDPSRDRILRARVAGEAEPVCADHYVLSVPIEHVGRCLGPAAERDPLLARLVAARRMTAWMVGAQFYLRRDLPICDGHVAYPDAPWALSSVSQEQFWRRAGGPAFAERYGDGRTRGVLSVDICEWDRPGSHTTRTAAECRSADEVLAEVWRQIQDGLNGGASPLLLDEDRIDWRLDANVTFGPHGAINSTPLLVHPPGSWWDRPEATTAIENLVLAADYVRTTTDLATMEGANEAARLAANAIFAREGRAARAKHFPLVEDAGHLVALARKLDAERWRVAKQVGLVDLELGEEPLGLDDAKARQEALVAALRQADASGAG